MSIDAEPQAIDDDADVIEEIADDATLIDGDQSDLAPDENASAESEEKVTFDERQQAKVEEIIGKSVQERREANERAAVLEAELAEARAKIPKPVRPNVPELPDPFDDDFAAKMAERDRVMAEALSHDAEQRFIERQAQQAEQNRIATAQATENARAAAYVGRATAAGISQQDLAQSIQSIAQAGGVGNDVVSNFIMEEDDGALTVHLGQNPMLVDQIRSMPAHKAVLFIENEVKPTLSGSKRATTAPSPATRIPSGGASSTTRGPKGATYA